MGNLRSVAKALEHVADAGQTVLLTSDADVIDSAERVLLPGQGAMLDCMRHLRQSGLQANVLAAASNKPLLGICVGEQMLFERSEEGPADCLGLFAGEVRRFEPELTTERGLKVPHMGWNRVFQRQPHPLWDGIADGAHFYFVHSYRVCPDDENLIMGESEYGVRFTCAVGRDNIFATQFHPEKSASDGLRLFHNFMRWNP
jgi:glutamine amidotransferase